MKNNDVQKVIELINKTVIPFENGFFEDKFVYESISAALVDAVLQPGLNYQKVVLPRVQNYFYKFGDFPNISDLYFLLTFVNPKDILQIKNKRKIDTFTYIVDFFYKNEIFEKNQVISFLGKKENQNRFTEIFGVGKKTLNYLQQIIGCDKIAIDRHLFNFLELAGIFGKNYDEAELIYRKVASKLEIPLTVLDNTVWKYMSKKKTGENNEVFSFVS